MKYYKLKARLDKGAEFGNTKPRVFAPRKRISQKPSSGPKRYAEQ